MSKNSIAIGELFNSNFDPMTIEISGIKKLSNAIPKDGNIDINNAEILATKYLRGADMCSELLAIATAHMQKTDTLKKSAYSTAALIKAQKAGIKTDKSKAWFADSDPDYIRACNKHTEAAAFVKWISSKYEGFVRAHYMFKKVLDRGYSHEGAAGGSGSSSKNEEDETW